MPVPLLPARSTAPAVREGLVPRTALAHRLLASHAPLVAVVAPAGYGKTTLLAQWVALDARPAAWLSLEPGCNDPAVLLSYLAVVLDRVLPLPAAVFDDLRAAHPRQRAAVVAALAAAVAAAPRPFLLVLDDAHYLTDAEGTAAVRTLAEHLPAGCRLALAGRCEPDVGLPRRRAEGQVLDIDATDLRMDATEARALFAAAGSPIADAEVAGLVERTEGWPIALYVAGFARRPGSVPPATAGRRPEAERLLADYIRAEILDQAPEARRRFLTRTSVLDELSGPLVDAVLQRHGSGAELERIAAATLLLVPLDPERRWWRYHHLLQDILRRDLERTEPEALAALAVRGSRWCEENGLFDHAVHYGQLAGDVERVSDVMLRGARRQVALGRAATVYGWFAWLAEHGCDHPGTAIVGAWLNMLGGRAAEAEYWLAVAEAGSADAVEPDGSPLQAWVLTARAAMAMDVREMVTAAGRALALLSPTSDWRPTATVALGFAEWLDGDLDAADRHLEDAAELGSALGSEVTVAVACNARAMHAIHRGRWPEALDLLQRASAQIEAADLRAYPHTALGHALRAQAAFHAGDLPAARREITAARALLPVLTRAFGVVAVQTRLELVRACTVTSDLPAAVEILDDARSLLPSGTELESTWADARAVVELVARAQMTAAGRPPLSAAELRLLPYLATQLSLAEIAGRLFLSPHTVKAQVTSIYRKLGVSSRTQAVDRARGLGLLTDAPAVVRAVPRPPSRAGRRKPVGRSAPGP